jgi:mono/diheme cytochrome c family protein
MADRDLEAIVAWLRAQPAVVNVAPRSVYRFPLPPSWGPSVGVVEAPARSDAVRYGEYVARIGHCMDCHTPRLADGRLVWAKLGAGGQVLRGPWGVSVSRNLTAHADGLQHWSDAEIERAIRHGVSRDGRRLAPPMAFDYYRTIGADDMAALIAYLRSLAPQAQP